jgi:hypothetical protein
MNKPPSNEPVAAAIGFEAPLVPELPGCAYGNNLLEKGGFRQLVDGEPVNLGTLR